MQEGAAAGEVTESNGEARPARRRKRNRADCFRFLRRPSEGRAHDPASTTRPSPEQRPLGFCFTATNAAGLLGQRLLLRCKSAACVLLRGGVGSVGEAEAHVEPCLGLWFCAVPAALAVEPPGSPHSGSLLARPLATTEK